MDISSILTKQVIDSLLHVAQRNMEREGFLTPVCFLRLTSGQRLVIDLSHVLSIQNHEQKRMALILLGKQIRDKGHDIAEVVMVLETWFVANKHRDTTTLAPSQHPNRQEAIVVVGRNAAHTRSSCVIQPFTRDGEQKLTWARIHEAVYNEPPAPGIQLVGLVDYLFVLTPAS